MANKKKKEKAKKPTKRAAEPEADVLEEVSTGGAGIDEGMIFTTFALLASAVYMIYTLLDGRYPDPIS